MRLIITFISVVIFFSASVCCAEAGDKNFHQEYSVAPGGQFILDTDNGSINIVGTRNNIVSVTVDIQGRDADLYEVTAEQQGNNVFVRGKTERQGSWFWNWSTKLNVKFTVQVPQQYVLSLNTSGGDISVSTITGSLYGKTSGGNLFINNIKGDIEFETSGGNITVEKSLGKIHMNTSGGHITASKVAGEIDMSTSGGNVKVSEAEGKIHVVTSGGNVTIDVRGENKGVYAETSGGNITIEVPKNIAADFDAQTFGGKIACDLPVTMSGGFDTSRIKGQINGGGPLIHARTSGGNVRIMAKE